uniref:ATP synthase F0 subunit 8 n=1 Tax=Araneus diadematus TaxID=45920 RepID=A0A7L7S1J7_ARADI|nr:ATP synthase F0 subunit 8 [Araneus diadematus]
MPQLMPLKWVFSSMMMLVILMSVGVIYSEKEKVGEVKSNVQSIGDKMHIWCW